ncbi:hypothetical protein H702_07210 [Streptococcus equinus JB1]|uniref:Phage protein n=1 Tax=Streptococcus equinus JB1 TaxID=1294274 RepID=A0A091BSM6_STREI|nr:hypothetical protein [Streptococcus equinus]KFN87440.1 hypothetical protein H702_07210 [Streptococcus equinus JB1]QBX15706.1 hypothetical protein Javan207_0020 [Streptococcus phage Javan207]SFL15869.1 hypothetical protein SAMN02910290_00686 [Streptococcus equinus JB1]
MEAYKQRFINEYKELKERTEKLGSILLKYSKGDLEFEPTCPVKLLQDQYAIMGDYLHVLEIRAVYEGVEL